MRRLAALVGISIVCLGCGGEPAPNEAPTRVADAVDSEESLPAGADSSSPDQEKPAEHARGAAPEEQESVYLGKPVSYWTDRAAGALKSADRDKTIEALILALEDRKPSVRVVAADALGLLKPTGKAATGALVAQLADKNAWVRVAAMETLGEMGPAAVPALLDALQTGTRSVRRRAALVLGSIGPDAKAAVPVLQKALEDESSAVHGLAAKVLAEIDPEFREPTATGPESPAEAPAVALATVQTTRPPHKTLQWPQFHGPNRDSLCPETGLMQQWPAQGPKLLWELRGLGRGYSTVSIADGKLFTMGDRTPQGQPEAQFVMAVDLATREELWATRVGPPHDDGPRCTPTVDGRLLYVIGTEGDLVCVETDSGTIRWQRSLPDDFGGKMMSVWKFSESPLVDGEKVVCTPGGKHATIVALDKKTGELIWESAVPDIGPQGKDGAGYSSIVVAEIDGVRQYVQMLGRGVVGVEADSGRFLWGYNRVANRIANITTPVVRGNLVFATTSYGTGSALLKITRQGNAFRAEEVYFLGRGQFENHHGGVVLVGDYLYGGNGQNKGGPVCLELATGKIVWKPKAPERGSAAVLYADGHLVFRYDRGTVAWIEANPEAFRVKGSFKPVTADGPAWPHPVIHDGKLYLRHNDVLLCYDLRG